MPLLSAAAASLHRDAFSLILKGLMTRRTRRLLILFVGLPGAFLAVVLLGFLAVIAFCGDLEPVRSRARANGIAITWDDLGRTANPKHAEYLRELQGIVSGLNNNTELGANWSKWMDPSNAIPEKMTKTFHQEKAALIIEMNSWFMRWDGMPLCIDENPNRVDFPSGYLEIHKLTRWLAERILVSPQLDPTEVCRALEFRRVVDSECPLFWFIRANMEKRILEACIRHLSVNSSNYPELAACIRRIADGFPQEYPLIMAGQVVVLNVALEQDPVSFSRWMGVPMPEIFEISPGLLRTYQSLGRNSILDDVCNDFLIMRDGISAKSSKGGWSKGLPHPATLMADLLYRELMHKSEHVWSRMQRHEFRLRVMAALFDGSELPDDPHSGGRPHAFIKNHRLQKIYGVGPNGIDDGGQGDDWWIQVYLPEDHPCLFGIPEPFIENDPPPEPMLQTPGLPLPPGMG